MTDTTQIQKLEAIVREKRTEYISLFYPSFDDKLMTAHYMLAEAYNGTDWVKAHEHFREAVDQFGRMCRQRQQERDNSDLPIKEWPVIITKDAKANREIAKDAKANREIASCSDSLWQLAREMGVEKLLMATPYSNTDTLFSYKCNTQLLNSDRLTPLLNSETLPMPRKKPF
ncbi:MAG: hypothetical protein V1734_00130 [Nanoarchaeota archaeon]